MMLPVTFMFALVIPLASSSHDLRPAYSRDKGVNMCQQTRYSVDKIHRGAMIKEQSTRENSSGLLPLNLNYKVTKYNELTCCPGWQGFVSGQGCVDKDFSKNSVDSVKCEVSLPQKTNPTCREERNERLKIRQDKLHLTKPKDLLQIPRLNMTTHMVLKMLLQDPLQSEVTMTYYNMVVDIARIFKKFDLKNGDRNFENLEEFRNNYEGIIGASRKVNKYMKYPFDPNQELFQNFTSKKFWQSDKYFVQMRLAGLNPMNIQRITSAHSDLNKNVGVKWNFLEQVLNSSSDWQMLVSKALEDDFTSLEDAIAQHRLYVNHYPSYYNLPNDPDIIDTRPDRKMWPSKSPIALFAVVTTDSGVKYKPVAIQLDYNPDSPVYSPEDGKDWLIAKKTLEATDYSHVAIIEHLLKTHLLMEPICVVLERQISNKHPLHQILKYHCRGIFSANSIGLHSLLNEGEIVDKLMAIGNTGAHALLVKEYKQLTWKSTDFFHDLKRRGMNSEHLEYYPYRDDGKLLFREIRTMARLYVKHYYKTDQDVIDDTELQAFLNEISAKGKGDQGGMGKIRKFPRRITHKKKLVDLITRIIWTSSGKHAAVNFPITSYGALTPVVPTKIYNIQGSKSNYLTWLPNAKHSSFQSTIAMSLGSLHYDSIFDYGDDLSDGAAKEIIKKAYQRIHHGRIKEKMEKRNKDRYERGDLTYPFLMPEWVPNSIST